MRVLADTSVWVAHFRQHNKHLAGLLDRGFVVLHPYVLIEIACGTPPDRGSTLSLLAKLEQAPVATHHEMLGLIEQRGLFGRGCGFVDTGLLACVLMDERIKLWTHDRRLASVASELGRSFEPESFH